MLSDGLSELHRLISEAAFELQLIQGLAGSKCSSRSHAFPSASVVGTDRMTLGFKQVIADRGVVSSPGVGVLSSSQLLRPIRRSPRPQVMAHQP